MSGNGVQRLKDVEARVMAGERLLAEDGLTLFEVTNLPRLAFLADSVRRRKCPEGQVTYVVGRIISRVARLCRKLGTEVTWQDGRGVILLS